MKQAEDDSQNITESPNERLFAPDPSGRLLWPVIYAGPAVYCALTYRYLRARPHLFAFACARSARLRSIQC
ncbi:hypothetical protein EVAR_36985_1 [Eumeta japonica]|uniref:Uncharacterized protein n=1 Tax=Eumeta variegata TaxID=151549 RepID=A0A4C1WZC5_EUMVA|nr:hypothetical protein EVAR_36985_1 [Eumeta japonica]